MTCERRRADAENIRVVEHLGRRLRVARHPATEPAQLAAAVQRVTGQHEERQRVEQLHQRLTEHLPAHTQHSLTFRVRAMLSWHRNPRTDCISAQTAQLEGTPTIPPSYIRVREVVLTRSTGTMHTSAMARLTIVKIRIQILVRDPDRHQI